MSDQRDVERERLADWLDSDERHAGPDVPHPSEYEDDGDGPRFWSHDLDSSGVADLLLNVSETLYDYPFDLLGPGGKPVKQPELVAIVDEKEGGIVAYALAPFADRIVKALEDQK